MREENPECPKGTFPLAIRWLCFSASAEISLFNFKSDKPFERRYWLIWDSISSSMSACEDVWVPLLDVGLGAQLVSNAIEPQKIIRRPGSSSSILLYQYH